MKCLMMSLFALVGTASCGNQSPPKIEEKSAEVRPTFDIKRGLNISHWLSQSKERGLERANYFIEKDIFGAKEAGFHHIRIPIDEEQMWDEEGAKNKEAFELLHQSLETMGKYGLKAIVDLHILRAHYFLDKRPKLFSDSTEQVKFANLWRQLSAELKKYPNEDVAYELLNESVAEKHEDWNYVYKQAYNAVREKEPNRVIFLGPNRWQNAAFFPQLDVPQDDPNIVLSFHFYEPHVITHYQASWSSMKDYHGPIQYPGICIDPKDTLDLPEKVRNRTRHFAQEFVDKSVLEAMMQPAFDKRDETGLQLYCGEFGCYDPAPEEIRFRWFKDVVEIFSEHQIAWTAWDFKSSGFGMLDPEDHSLIIPKEILFIEH